MFSCPKSQSGNVLFLILLAVALFAALSYAVSKSTSGKGNSGKSEQVKTQAGEILSFASTVSVAVMRLRAGGCSETQISMDGPVTGTIKKAPAVGDNNLAYVNSNAPANKSCNVFDPAGGNVAFVQPPAAAQEKSKLDSGYHNRTNMYFFNANNMIEAVGSAKSELLMMLPYVTKDLCNEINKRFGISGVITGNLDLNINNPYQGTYNNWSHTDPPFDGKMTGCIEASTGNYYFYHVLLAR